MVGKGFEIALMFLVGNCVESQGQVQSCKDDGVYNLDQGTDEGCDTQ